MSRRKRRQKHHTLNPLANKPGERQALTSTDPLFSPDTINIIGYGPQGFEEVEITKASEIAPLRAKWPVLWIDIDGLGNADLILAVSNELSLPTLVVEDVFNVKHMPKVEMYDDFIFMVLKNGIYTEIFESEQISLVLMEKVVLTIQERPGDSFLPVRNRLKDGKGKMSKSGPDYLAYALIDAVVEGYYPILEMLKNRLDSIEDNFILDRGSHIIRQIHDVKNDLLFLHSAIWPIRDITLALAHDDIPVVTASTRHNLRDCQDQAKQVTELAEFYRMIANDLMSTFLAFSDNKANEVMKVLTMVSTLFIPLSFLTGFYGMNWDRSSPYNMPELGYRYGYPILISFMLVITTGILIMFWKRGWFNKSNN